MGEREKKKEAERESAVFFPGLYLFAPSSKSEGLEQAITSRFKIKPDLDPGEWIELN